MKETIARIDDRPVFEDLMIELPLIGAETEGQLGLDVARLHLLVLSIEDALSTQGVTKRRALVQIRLPKRSSLEANESPVGPPAGSLRACFFATEPTDERLAVCVVTAVVEARAGQEFHRLRFPAGSVMTHWTAESSVVTTTLLGSSQKTENKAR